MNKLSVHHLVVRGRSKKGSKSLALPLTHDEIKAFGLDPDDAEKANLIVNINKDRIVISKPTYWEEK